MATHRKIKLNSVNFYTTYQITFLSLTGNTTGPGPGSSLTCFVNSTTSLVCCLVNGWLYDGHIPMRVQKLLGSAV